MVVSGKVHLFAGMHLVKVGESKIPIVETALEHLAALGLEIATVLWDREFYRAELVDAVKSTGADMLMPAKIYMRVAALIDEYLAGSRGRVMKYTFSTSTANTQRIAVRAWLVLGATKQQNLGAIRRACQSGLLPASEARKNIYAFLVVRRPRSRAGSWESKLSRQYKGRWQVEMGFSDKNQLAPRWRTNIDHERLLGEIGRCLIYNAWQLMAAGERQQSARERPVRLRAGIDALKRAVQIYVLQDRMKGVKLTQ